MFGQHVAKTASAAQVHLGTSLHPPQMQLYHGPAWAVSQFGESVEGGCTDIEPAHTSLTITFSEAIIPVSTSDLGGGRPRVPR